MVVLVPNAETDNLNLAAVFYTLQHAIFQHIMTFEVNCSQQTFQMKSFFHQIPKIMLMLRASMHERIHHRNFNTHGS